MTRTKIATLALLGALVPGLSALASDEAREGPAGVEAAGAPAATGAPPAATGAPPAATGAAPAAEPQAGAATSPQAGADAGTPVESPEGRVARATFTHAVADREPTDSIDSLANDQTQISFFSEVLGLQGQVVSHRWEYNGEWAAEVLFEVGGPRWRVYSTKRLDPIETGTWTVSVVDASGRVLEKASFEYRKAGAAELGTAEPDEAAPTAPAAPQP